MERDIFDQELLRLQQLIKEQTFIIFKDHLQYDDWTSHLGCGRTGFCQGTFLENAGANVSFIKGDHLPPSASKSRINLHASSYSVSGLSVIFHPDNPFIPTAHMNIRRFKITTDTGEEVSWFGGGFDLTPYFPNIDDVYYWHSETKIFLDQYDKTLYNKWKEACDHYFYLPHRKESRGIGGVFFDDLDVSSVTEEIVVGLANLFIKLYFEICSRNINKKYTEKEKEFQKIRRGRYVEFNLLYDRGTIFGLQSGGRVESILISLPGNVSWKYLLDQQHKEMEAGLKKWLQPRNWCDLNIIDKLQIIDNY